ncbi:MAG: hypothetical protein WC356_05345 [Candidatus Micrarchaeia archaeon]|jgi:hypothetical protein
MRLLSASKETRILVLESWALYGNVKDAKDALIELSKTRPDKKITQEEINRKIKNISLNAKEIEIRELAKTILFEIVKAELDKKGLNLIKAKDLVEANP